ncbi:MAG: iron-containing alcohol dehydrogenase [Sphaerochaetaceae bacterium]|nr:iron-containing alcohol dehydrogenase [Sphaerochaetaceae bacterium]
MKDITNRNLLDNPVKIVQTDCLNAKFLLDECLELDPKLNHITFIVDNAPIEEKNILLKEMKTLINTTVLDDVHPNPITSDINNMASKISDTSIIVGIGGGSVMDSAKALAMLKTNKGDLEDYLTNNPKRKIEKESLPLVLIPTTAGTGSEMTKVGVYTSLSHRKYTLGSVLMHAKKAILNTEYIKNMPPALIASTGADALDHALETIWNKNANDATRKLAIEVSIDIITNLYKMYQGAVNKDQDIDSCRNMLLASAMAGATFSTTGTAAGHALSFVLSEDFNVPHGSACAFTLLDIYKMSSSLDSVKSSLAQIAKAFFKDSDEDKLISKLYEKLKQMFEDMKLPTNFKELGVEITKDDIDSHFSRAFDDPKMWNQIPKATKENIYPFLVAKC